VKNQYRFCQKLKKYYTKKIEKSFEKCMKNDFFQIPEAQKEKKIS
jgi:hypothetical protein